MNIAAKKLAAMASVPCRNQVEIVFIMSPVSTGVAPETGPQSLDQISCPER